MDGAAADRAAPVLDRLVHMVAVVAGAAEGRDQRGMDIDHRSGELRGRRIELEVPGQADDIDIIAGQDPVRGLAVIGMEGGIAVAFGLVQTEGGGNVGDYHLDRTGHAAVAAPFVKIVQGPATAGEQDCHLQHRSFSCEIGVAVDVDPVQPPGDGGIVARGEVEDLDREAKPGLQGGVAGGGDLGQHLGVIGRVDDDGDILKILGRGPQQGRAADIDILDGIGKAASGIGDGLLEGVEIDGDEVDILQAVFGMLAWMLIVAMVACSPPPFSRTLTGVWMSLIPTE